MNTFIRKTWVITDFEIRKIVHDPTEVLMRAVQPALWLLIFGQVMARTRMVPGENYLDFMSPGILAQSVLFVSIFYGIAIIWNPVNLIGVLLFLILGAILFSTFSLIIACFVNTRQRFMGIGQILTMPL